MPNLQKYQRVFKHIGVASVVLLLIGLLGWYFFLRGQTSDIEQLGEARGFNIAVPSFTGTRSSTSENITSGFGSASLLFQQQTNQRPPRLWRVSQSPVAGMGFLTDSMIRYVERSTGHIYDVDPERGTVTRRSNTLIPKIYHAEVTNDGAVVMHTLTETGARMTALGRLSTTTSEEGLAGLETRELGSSVLAVALSQALPELLLVVARQDGGVELIRSTSEGTSTQAIAPLPLSNLVPQWLANDRIVLSEKPASGVLGSLYEITEDEFVPIIRNLPGLVALPHPHSAALLFSTDTGSSLTLFARSSSEETSFFELPLQTTAAKCIWEQGTPAATSSSIAYCAAPQNVLPENFTDQWLRGSAHTQDVWFKVDVSAARLERFFAPDISVALDVERPMINASGTYLTFMNARDKSLWVLRIAE